MIYFLIPIYNESPNLEKLAQRLLSCLPDFKKFYVFVDDHSSDDSEKKILSLFPADRLKLITKETNKGPGDSFNVGFEWILADSDDSNNLVVTMEGDNTSDITLLDSMVAISGLGYDLVLSSVYAQGGGFDQTSFFRKLISFIANQIFRFLYDVKILTLSSFYRVYKISLLRKIKMENRKIIEEPGFVCMLEILIKAIRAEATMIEVPMVLHSKDRKGKSKMKLMKTAVAYFRFLMKRKSS